MSTRSRKILFLGKRARLVRRADKLAAICELNVYTMWEPQKSQSYRPPRPVTGITYFLLLFIEGCRHLECGTMFLQDPHGATHQKMTSFMVTAVKTSNPA
jgi:hypothetical protein